MKGKFRFLYFLIILFSLVLSAGCNREKAEAIKVAAENFRMEAISAIEKINRLFAQSITMPIDETSEIDRIVRDLEREDAISAEKLSLVMGEAEIGKGTSGKVNEEFEKIKKGYYQFEAMFRSFPKGSFFAARAVKKAEKHAIQLTVQMLNFVEFLKNYPVQFTGRRTIIIETIREAKQIQDLDRRKERLSTVTKEILQLREEEQKAKQEAILQCLKAAEAGRLIADLIRNYDSLNAEELLIAIRNSFSFVAEMSGSQKVTLLLEKYKAVETAIYEDPYWKEVLSEQIIRVKSHSSHQI